MLTSELAISPSELSTNARHREPSSPNTRKHGADNAAPNPPASDETAAFDDTDMQFFAAGERLADGSLETDTVADTDTADTAASLWSRIKRGFTR